MPGYSLLPPAGRCLSLLRASRGCRRAGVFERACSRGYLGPPVLGCDPDHERHARPSDDQACDEARDRAPRRQPPRRRRPRGTGRCRHAPGAFEAGGGRDCRGRLQHQPRGPADRHRAPCRGLRARPLRDGRVGGSPGSSARSPAARARPGPPGPSRRRRSRVLSRSRRTPRVPGSPAHGAGARERGAGRDHPAPRRHAGPRAGRPPTSAASSIRSAPC